MRRLLSIWARCCWLVLPLLVVGCSESDSPVEEKPDLIVLHTARLRGNVVPEGLRKNGTIQHYPYIAGYVKKVREEAARSGAQVVLVDLGDSLSGSFAASVTNSANMVTFFNELKYDAVMLGNLDANLTPEVLKPLKMPVLCPFLDGQGATAMPGTVTHTTVKKGAWQVELLANYSQDEALKGNEADFPSYFGPVSESVPLRDYAALVRALPQRTERTVRLLACMKFLQLGGAAPDFLKGVQKLGVDAVLGHQPYGNAKWLPSSKFVGWETPVSLSILRDNRGLSLSRADLKRVNGKWVMLKQTNLNMVSNTAAADGEIERKVAQFKPVIEKADQPVLYISEEQDQAAVREFYLYALAAVPGTQVALCGNNNNSVRAPWRRGNIGFSDLYESLPWSNKVAQFDLSREEYAAMLQNKRLFGRYDVFVSKEAKTADKVTVTTTNYLTRELANYLGWGKYPSMRIVDTRPEYLFFADYLAKKYDASLDSTELAGWEYPEPPKETPAAASAGMETNPVVRPLVKPDASSETAPEAATEAPTSPSP